MKPRYTIYIISKGRWESRLTVKSLEQMNVPYTIVVEPQEFDRYAAVIDEKKILVTPFSNLGQGSIPVRNFVWEDALNKYGKDSRHWILDDNIDGFGRLNYNLKLRVRTGSTFRAIEDWVDRYENIGIAGMEYDYFITRKSVFPPLRLNTRIYSCILLKNDLPYRWRGKYNEDTDLSLRALKDGWCTALFIAFYCYKTPTLLMSGGNTDTIYNTGDKRKEFAESLKEQHPDCVQVVWRYNRWHHDVDYSRFKNNKLKMKDGLAIKPEIDNYGMVLIQDSNTEEKNGNALPKVRSEVYSMEPSKDERLTEPEADIKKQAGELEQYEAENNIAKSLENLLLNGKTKDERKQLLFEWLRISKNDIESLMEDSKANIDLLFRKRLLKEMSE